jgi:hypothetical protein
VGDPDDSINQNLYWIPVARNLCWVPAAIKTPERNDDGIKPHIK